MLDFTAHAVIFTDADPGWVRAQLTQDDLAAPLRPDFLQALGQRPGGRPTAMDMVCLARPLPGPPPSRSARRRPTSHSRVAAGAAVSR